VIRRITVQSQPGKIAGEDLSQKNPIQKMTDELAQGVGLCSNPSIGKKKEEDRHKTGLVKCLKC
jgi:hypothetical protein